MSNKILLATFCGVLAVWSTNCFGQPLVDGSLSVYYSFDAVDEDGLYTDGSGNGLHGQTTLGFEDANDDGLDDIRLVTEGAARGAGYALFDTVADVKEDYIAICDPVNQPDHNDGCGEFLDDRADYVPSTAFSIAAWLKVEDVGQDHSIYQSRAGGGGFVHIQLQSNGNARFHLRGDANGDNLVSFNEPVNDGDVIDYEEWIHFAGTWDSSVGDFGEAAIFYNGEEVARFEANGNVAGDPDFGVLGDWAQGAFVGLVPDFNRQLVGGVDEFYMFTRAITADEVGTLYALDPGCATIDECLAGLTGADRVNAVHDQYGTWMGDANLDGVFDSGDMITVFQAGLYETGAAALWADGDFDGNGAFESGDLVAALADGGYEAGPRPAVAAVPEPSSVILLAMGMLLVLKRRRR